MANSNIITKNLNRNFQAVMRGEPIDPRDFSPDIASIRAAAFAEGQASRIKNSSGYSSSAEVSNTGLVGLSKMASGGVVYTQPQFFSPIHTPINWQIPVKRKEQYQWQIVAGQLLEKDYTYTDITDFSVDGEQSHDLVTDGTIWENPITETIISGNGLETYPVKWSKRSSQEKVSYEFYACGRSFSVTEEHEVYVLDKNGNMVKKEAKDVSTYDHLLTPAIPFSQVDALSNIEVVKFIGVIAAQSCVDNGIDHATLSVEEDDAILSQFFHSRPPRLSDFVIGNAPALKFQNRVFNFSHNEIMSLLGAWFNCVGVYNPQTGCLETDIASKDISDQLWWMLVRCGIYASLSKQTSANQTIYRINIPHSGVDQLSHYMPAGRVPVYKTFKSCPSNIFFHTHEDVRYLCQPINQIRKFLYTGLGFDMQIDPCKSYVLSGFKVSNCRFFYENEPKVAQALEFHSKFPINGFTNECHNRYVKHFFDKLSEKLNLLKWLRVMSHEVHLLGDCFPFLEVECSNCHGSGVDRHGKTCEHENGSFKRLVVLNPENVEVYSDPISPDSLIAFMPNDELRTLIMKRGPGYERFSQDIAKMIMAGVPIPLDNRNVSHIKYAENGYNKYGIGMVRRLFPILAYKTKLMTAQWIIAERLILPIKVAKVGSDERPASAGDLADINSKLAQVANDPNLTLVTHHAFELDWFGASLSDDTQILTENGWKFRTELVDNESVATYNVTTENLEFQVPIVKQEYEFNGDMFQFKSRDVDVMVTPDHKMVASEWDAKSGYQSYQKYNADQLPSFFKFLASAKWDGCIPSSFDFVSSELTNSYIDDILRFAGYYVSEGYIKIDGGIPRAVSICQNEENPVSNKIHELMKKMFGHIQVNRDDRTGKTSLQFYANNTSLSKEVMSIFGSNAVSKRLPKWMINLPVEKLLILFSAMMEGDGSSRTSANGFIRHRYSTASLVLADQVQEIMLKLGCASQMKHEKSLNKKHNDMFRIYWSDARPSKGFSLSRYKHITRVPYNGKVWCLTVPNGTLITRRNGKIGIHGNSGKIMQLTNEFEIISQEILDGLGVNKVLLNGEGPCFHPDVEILTENGWKNYQSVLDNEKIGTFNSKTNGLEYQHFKNRIVRDYDGDLVHFKCSGNNKPVQTETLVTTNHRMWGQNTDGEWSVSPAEDIQLGTVFRTAPDDWPQENEIDLTTVNEIDRVPYKGKVWCFEVPNEFLVVRLHGKPLIAGNTYSSAAIGVEVMIDKLDAWRNELSEWVEQKIYLQVAKMMNFIEKNEWGEYEYVYPRLKWNIMHLRDQQQMRTFMLQLHEKGTISTQTMLKTFDIDYDQEVELLRYERAKGAATGGDQQGGMGAGFGGGGAGGGLPDLGGLGGGGDMGGLPGGGDMGGGGEMGAAASSSVANIREFGGKVLKKRSREKITKYKDRLFKSRQQQDDISGYSRDDKGRIQFTGPERELMKELVASVKRGEIRHNLQAQFPVQTSGEEYTLDFAMPDIKLGIEVDGALFHSTDEQIASDKKRDDKLAQLGWTILRFTDKEVENHTRQVIEVIIKQQIQKENWFKQLQN